MEAVDDGFKVGRILRDGVSGRVWSDTGVSAPPTIFNVVVDAVVQHWVTVVVEGAEEQGERGQESRKQAAPFYAEDGMVASLDPRWIQGAFNTLVGLFDRVGLQTNIEKTVGMVCCP